MSQSVGLTDVLDQIRDQSSGEKISVQDIVRGLEDRGFGPALLAPALIVVLPTGAIPGIPSACGLLIFLIAIQRVFGKSHPWIPQRLAEVEFERDRYIAICEKVEPVTRRLDRWFRPRLPLLTKPLSASLIALCCASFGLAMIPLELLPLAAALPAFAILLAGLGLSTRDGVVLLFSFVLFGLAFWFSYDRFSGLF